MRARAGDARMGKATEGYARDWPKLVRMSDEIKERITRHRKMYYGLE